MTKENLNNPDEISLKELLLSVRKWSRQLISYWKILLLTGLIGGGLGLAYAFKSKTLYKAELSFALGDEKGNSGVGGALVSQFGLDLGSSSNGEFSGDNLLELMKSRSMITRALLTPVTIQGNRQTLIEYYIKVSGLREKWNDNPNFSSIHFLPGDDSLKLGLKKDSLLGDFYKGLLKSNLNVAKIDKKLSIIVVTVTSTDEQFSKYFAEILTNVVSNFYIQTKTEKEVKNVAILKHQTDSVKAILNENIAGVATTTDINPNPNPYLQTLRVPSQRRQVEVQANTATYAELKRNLEIANMSVLQETPLIQIIDQPILPLDKIRVSKLIAFAVGFFFAATFTIIIITCKAFFKNLIIE